MVLSIFILLEDFNNKSRIRNQFDRSSLYVVADWSSQQQYADVCYDVLLALYNRKPKCDVTLHGWLQFIFLVISFNMILF